MTKRFGKSSKSVAVRPTDYAPLLAEIKTRIRTAQVKAALAANAELVLLYWQMGQRIAEMQAKEGWGAGVIPRLAADLHAEFPEKRGFSERNLKTVEYALRDLAKPIGVAGWKTRLVESLPKKLRGALPSIEELEKRLADDEPR